MKKNEINLNSSFIHEIIEIISNKFDYYNYYMENGLFSIT